MRVQSIIVLTVLGFIIFAHSQGPLAQVSKPEVAKLKVGMIPILDYTPLYIAIKKGYLKEEGLEVEAVPTAGGAVAIEALAAGQIQFAYSNIVSTILARAQGFDFAITAGTVVLERADDPSAGLLLVKSDSPIKRIKDLEGKKIAVNTLKGIVWLYVRATLKKYGVDLTKVEFFEIPFPPMNAALLQGRFDAIAQVDPFGVVLLESGEARSLGNFYTEAQESIDVAHYIASEKWIKEHPVAVEKFARALGQAIDFLNTNKEEGLKYMSEATRIKPEIIRNIRFYRWRARPVDVSSLQRSADLMLEHGLLKGRFDVNPLIYRTAR